MSGSDLQRLATDLAGNSDHVAFLRSQLRDAVDPEDVVHVLRRNGYEITLDELARVANAHGELSEAELEGVAGGAMTDEQRLAARVVMGIFTLGASEIFMKLAHDSQRR